MVVLQRNIEGVTYQAIPEINKCDCDGCIAFDINDGGRLCGWLSETDDGHHCLHRGIIWAKVDPKDQLPGFGTEDIPKDAINPDPSVDSINPLHYKVGGIETIEYLKAKLSPEEFQGYLKGNALKYLSRSNYKHEDPMEDFKKALWYVTRLTQG